MDNPKIKALIQDFFEQNGTAHIQIDSYNNFIRHGIERVIENASEISVSPKKNQKYTVKFGQVYVANPMVMEEDRSIHPLLPSEARLRDLTYESCIHVDIHETLTENDTVVKNKTHSRVIIGQIPTMVKSCVCNLNNMTTAERIKNSECEYDEGGYFIINGGEKCIITQQRANYNYAQVLLGNKVKVNCKYKYVCEIRSISEDSGYCSLVQAQLLNDERTIVVSLPHIKETIPAGVVFKAMGFLEDDVIQQFINMNNKQGQKYVTYLLRDALIHQTQEQAMYYIASFSMYTVNKEKQLDFMKQILEIELLPHLGVTATVRDKAEYLGYMINKLINTQIGLRKDDDRDNLSNKRFENTGILVTELFRSALLRYLEILETMIQKRPDVLFAISKCSALTSSILMCFATGSWAIKKTARMRTGVAQTLNRMNYAATRSHLRHINIPVGKEGKNAKIRQIHTSQFGFICPAETPEGHTAGIVTNYSLLARVSKRVPSFITKNVVLRLMKQDDTSATVKVFVNGILLGKVSDVNSFLSNINNLRSKNILHSEVSAFYDLVDDEIRIFSDEGRLMRPLFVVSELSKLDAVTTWNDAVECGLVRYIDTNETENSVIAMFPDKLAEFPCDFLEIDPSMILGVCASIIPFPDHSQSPRNCYQSSMGKQALGVPCLNFTHRTDTKLYVMDTPMKPIVSTKAADFLKFNDMPSGQMAIVAITTKEGFNQEDSVCLNKSAIDRGLFRLTCYHTITKKEEKMNNCIEVIELPKMEIRKNKYNYSYLDERGIVRPGSPVKIDDVIIGKTLTRISKDDTDEKKDVSVAIKSGEEGVVHRVHFMTNTNGYKMVKIVIRNVKIPEVGDKFASRAAQKGTCGMVFSQEDMPFTADGITPDLIINPHCIPSRMTINQLLECVLSKKCVMKGQYGDATPFSENSVNIVDELCNELQSCGYERHGLETMFNPYTGEEMRAKIFIGPTFYQRLKHMVSDKIHSRAKGQVTALHRQPLEGRSRDGGLRFGEMERDAMISQGVAEFLKERLFHMSDPYTTTVCSLCGMIASSPDECKGCNDDKMEKINVPFSAKLLFQELMAMGVKLELIPDSN